MYASGIGAVIDDISLGVMFLKSQSTNVIHKNNNKNNLELLSVHAYSFLSPSTFPRLLPATNNIYMRIITIGKTNDSATIVNLERFLRQHYNKQ